MQRTPLGKLLFYDVPARSMDEHVRQVEGIVRDRVVHARRTLRQIGISASKTRQDVLLDGPAVERLADPTAERHAGSANPP